MKMTIPISYEIPIFLFMIVGFYTIYQLVKSRGFGENCFKDSDMWLTFATIFFVVWALDHTYRDLNPFTKELEIFYHYVVSHVLLLFAMICMGFSARQKKLTCIKLSKKKEKKK